MKIYLFLDLESKTNLDRILGKNLLVDDRLISPIYKTAKLVIQMNNKIQEPKTYNKVIMTQFIGATREKLLIKNFKT